MKIWYAVRPRDDFNGDYSTGSFNRRDAVRMALRLSRVSNEKHIVVAMDPKDGFALNVILYDELKYWR